MYGAGMGHHLNEEKMRSIVSTPGDYYYHRTSDWLDILTSGALAKRNGRPIIFTFHINILVRANGCFHSVCLSVCSQVGGWQGINVDGYKEFCIVTSGR